MDVQHRVRDDAQENLFSSIVDVTLSLFFMIELLKLETERDAFQIDVSNVTSDCWIPYLVCMVGNLNYLIQSVLNFAGYRSGRLWCSK